MDNKLRPCPFCKSNNVRIFNILRKPIEIVCNECLSIYPNIIDKYKAESEAADDQTDNSDPGI